MLAVFLPIAGCQPGETTGESRYDQISQQIEQLKADSQAAASTGDNIRIQVNMLTTSMAERFAVDTLWLYADFSAAVARHRDVFARSGLRVGFAGKTFLGRLDAVKRKLKSAEQTELFIVVADGASGYINIGKEITVPRFYYFGRWYNAVNYEFRRAGRSLKVTARKLPAGFIQMELTPVFSNFLSSGDDIELTELSTTVVAGPGQTFVIGGGDIIEQDTAAALFTYTTNTQQKQTIITVTPYLE